MEEAVVVTTSVDSTLAIVLGVIIACVSVVWYVWSGRFSRRGGGGGGSGISANRIAQATSNSREDIQAIAEECQKSGKLWKDPNFGHDPYPGPSIGYHMELRDGERGNLLHMGSGGVTWQPPQNFTSLPRPIYVRGDGVPTWLYSDNKRDGVVTAAEGMDLSDSHQGSVGDCYFMSALAALVQHHPDLADDLIDETYEEQGIYGVSFWLRGQWRMIWVDSYFPCYRPSSSSKSHRRGKYRLVFATADDRKEIWPLVVEKAFAKLAGSYESISGGHISDALQILTGGHASRRRTPRGRGSDQDWQTFMEQVKSDDYLVGAGSQQQATMSADAAKEQKKALKGIVTGHAYTVVNAYQDGDNLLRLVELRNPWGRGEWTGDWGAGSSKWYTEQGRKAQSVVGSANSSNKDGRFWMAWEDFTSCFDSIDSVFMNFSDQDKARRAALREEATRFVTKQERPNAPSSEYKPAKTDAEAAADAMMMQLIAEEAAEKRKNSVGARGNKKKTKKR